MLSIEAKHPPDGHPDFGMSHNNIATVYHRLGVYDLAFEHYNRSLETRLRSLPNRHPDIVATYKNMGLMHESKDELEQALTLLQKASIIYESNLSFSQSNVVTIKDIVRRLQHKLKISMNCWETFYLLFLFWCDVNSYMALAINLWPILQKGKTKRNFTIGIQLYQI